MQINSNEVVSAFADEVETVHEIVLGNADTVVQTKTGPVSTIRKVEHESKQLIEDLANSDEGRGAGMIGFIQKGIGAVSRTVQEKLRGIEFSVLDFGAIGDGVVNDDIAVNAAIAALPMNGILVFPAGKNVAVTRIALNNKSDFSIRVDGKITNIAIKAGGAGANVNDTERGKNATFYITNCSRFNIYGGGCVDPGSREAFYIGCTAYVADPAPCTDFEISVDIRGSAVNDNIHCNVLRYCSHFVLNDMVIDQCGKKPVYVDNASPYYHSWVENILFWDCTDFSLSGVTSRNSAMNGVYIGSNCERFSIDNCALHHNAGSGLQIAWSSFGSFPRFFRISENEISLNRADGCDVNNTGATVDCFGIVSGNLSYYNGWGSEDAACLYPTNDGSGIGTYVNVRKIIVTNNFDIECSRAGVYAEGVWDAQIAGNFIKKEALSFNGDGVFILRCTNIDVSSNNVDVVSSRRALYVYGDDENQGGNNIEKNRLVGKIVYAGGVYGGGVFNNNYVISNETISMPVHASGNSISVAAAGQDGVTIVADNIKIERNKISGARFGLIAFGRYGAELVGNMIVGGDGGIRMDACAISRVSMNVSRSNGASPAIHLLNSADCELSLNQGNAAAGGNSIRVESTCTNTQKWANRSVSGFFDYQGTYGINF
jgi:hypothetical protein